LEVAWVTIKTKLDPGLTIKAMPAAMTTEPDVRRLRWALMAARPAPVAAASLNSIPRLKDAPPTIP
jgi:hypothetical protein